ncbi:riboflavin synthase [Actinomyces polynesiensis]|uniref:riboflavin synthase n=1 Tax=Actinomyces polynesiensis TaxID=1325934 RepID=UPI00069324D4|nr:riboflavin synthase [Actinomyces polynesiensis]
MFTGIVEEVGTIVSTGPEPGGGAALRIRGPLAAWGARQGDSIAVAGACLTVVDQPTAEEFVVDVMPETLRRTSLGSLQAGSPVNLERSLRADARLHGTSSRATSTVWVTSCGAARKVAGSSWRSPCPHPWSAWSPRRVPSH